MIALRLLFILNGVAIAVVLPFASVILADRGGGRRRLVGSAAV